MDAVGHFRCPRHYFGRGHVRGRRRADASQSSFAAVAYWRVTYENDDVLVSFVMCQKQSALRCELCQIHG